MLHKLENHAKIQHSVLGMKLWLGWVGLSVAVGVAYFLTAQLGLALLTTAERVAVFWPASGIAVGILIALGGWARGPVSAGVIAATLAANLMADRSVWSALAFGLCNAAEALLAMWLIERWFGHAFNLDSLRRVLGFFAAAAVATATAAVGASGAMTLFGPSTAAFLDVWEVWFASDALGVITIAPLLIGAAAAVRDRPSWRELVEGTVAVAAVTATIGFLLLLLSGPWEVVGPGAFLFPLLLWLGYRCRPVFAAAAVFTIAAAIVWTITHEFGRYGDSTQATAIRVIAAQTAMLGTTLAALALSALFAERRRSEAALRESDTRLRSSLDAANAIAWDVDLERDTVHPTGPVSRIFDRPEGLEPHDFAGFVECIHPEDRERVMAQFWMSVSTAATYRLEFRLNSDRLCWVTAEGSIERDADGRPVRVRGITQDITERKKAELTLAERESQLGLAGKAARVGSFAVDYATQRIQTSPGYRVIHGLAEGTEEYPREEWRARVHPDDLPRVEVLRRQAFAERCSEHYMEYRIVGEDGETRWIESRGLVSYDGDGRPTRLVGVHIDITERKRVEEQQGKLVAELDHRVKNVLATVQAVAAQTMQASSSMEHFVAALDGRIRSMGSTHELLSHRRWLGIPLADLVGRELAPYTTGSNTEIGGPEVVLSAEAAQTMAMVLHELVTNAAKYGSLSTRDGRVSVRWYPLLNGNADPRLCIEWQETGGPSVQASEQTGYGTEVIRRLLPYELEGEVDLVFATEGVRCRFSVPLSRLTGRNLRADTFASRRLHG